MKLFFAAWMIFSFQAKSFGKENPVFKLSQTEIPKVLDPHKLRSTSGNFLNQQLYRNFYVYDNKKSYVPELGESCLKKNLIWKCKIKRGLKWSDGSAITALDFVLSARRILTLPAPRADLLFNIENASEVFSQKKPPDELGVKLIDSQTFEITWKTISIDNNLFLMSPLFVPLPNGQYRKDVFSGPYQLSDQNNQHVLLSPNLQYYKKNSRPQIDFQIFEENLAVKAYERNQLDFLRRVPTAQIAGLEKRPDFYWYSVLRFDSIAFGPELKNQFQLRRSLAESLSFSELQNLFKSPGQIGCTGLSDQLSTPICYSQKKTNLQSNKKNSSLNLSFVYSTGGGDDHRRLAEWLQSQWKKNLQINISLQPLENKIFQNLIESKPPPLFRKGLNLEVPTCYHVLQNFISQNPDNYLGFKNKAYDATLAKLATSSAQKSKKICSQALRILMDSFVLIPTGKIHFAAMVSPRWKGWRLNELNHLDLSELQAVP